MTHRARFTNLQSATQYIDKATLNLIYFLHPSHTSSSFHYCHHRVCILETRSWGANWTTCTISFTTCGTLVRCLPGGATALNSIVDGGRGASTPSQVPGPSDPGTEREGRAHLMGIAEGHGPGGTLQRCFRFKSEFLQLTFPKVNNPTKM